MRPKLALTTVIILLILAGCNSSSTPFPGTGRDDVGQRVDFRKGTQGIQLRFLPGTPPTRVYEGDPLTIVVEATNKGTYDVGDGYLYVSGHDPTYILLNRDEAPLTELAGKSLFNPEGLFSNTFDFEDSAVSMPDTTDKFPQIIKATTCYPYQTQTSAEICIDPDPYGIQLIEKVCQTQSKSIGGGQGAPVAITRIDQETARDRTQFKITVQNAGGGTVIDPTKSVLDCHEGLDRRDVDKVRLLSVEFSGNEIVQNCEPNPIRLVNGAGYAFCGFDGNLGDDAFLTILNLVLDYGYRTSISTSVDILEIR